MGVPHDCLIAEKGLDSRLGRYKIIVVPELSLVDDEDATALKKYVQSGGRLLVMGEMGTFFGSGQEIINRETSLSALWAGEEMTGKEMIAFGPPDADEFRAACEKVGISSQLKIESASPIETAVRATDSRRAIHLIRFGDPDALKDRAVTVDCELPKGFQTGEVSVWSPDFASVEMSFSSETVGGRLRVKISRLDDYALLGIVLKSHK